MKVTECQNNYKVSANDLADAIGVVGSAARMSGTNLQELEGYVTAITAATGVTGNESGTALN